MVVRAGSPAVALKVLHSHADHQNQFFFDSRSLRTATGGIFLFYMIDLVMGFFGHHVTLLYSNGPWGIAISVFIVIVAALNLILDFDFIETGVYDALCRSDRVERRAMVVTPRSLSGSIQPQARRSTWNGTEPSASW